MPTAPIIVDGIELNELTAPLWEYDEATDTLAKIRGDEVRDESGEVVGWILMDDTIPNVRKRIAAGEIPEAVEAFIQEVHEWGA